MEFIQGLRDFIARHSMSEEENRGIKKIGAEMNEVAKTGGIRLNEGEQFIANINPNEDPRQYNALMEKVNDPDSNYTVRPGQEGNEVFIETT